MSDNAENAENTVKARLFTSREVFAVDFDGLVYVEGFGTITPALVTDRVRHVGSVKERWLATRQLGGAWVPEDMYGTSWRCWTSRPTDEECRNTPWDCRL